MCVWWGVPQDEHPTIAPPPFLTHGYKGQACMKRPTVQGFALLCCFTCKYLGPRCKHYKTENQMGRELWLGSCPP